jgi:hypothetical protein
MLCLLVACSGPDDVAKNLTLTAKGLYTQPNDLGEVPPGALTQADNVVISRDGIVEPRRGSLALTSPGVSVDRLIPYAGRLLGHAGSSLGIAASDFSVWGWYSASFTKGVNSAIRSVVANQNLYVSSAEGIQRLDDVGHNFEPAGISPGLDLQLSLTGAGTAVPTNSEVAYRIVWAKRDQNNNLILGAPSGRAVISNAAGSTQNVSVSFSVPRSLPSGAFFQAYRTSSSVSSSTDPGDEMGLVYQGTPPTTASITQLARATNVVTATTAAAHGYSTGQVVRVSPGGFTGGFAAVGTNVAASSTDAITWTSRTNSQSLVGAAWNGSVYAAVGLLCAASSTDGVTWTTRTIPSGAYYGVAWTGSVFVAVGTNLAGSASVCATSPDGITWTSRTMAAGLWYGIAWNGSTLVAVGASIGTTTTLAATSPDGITWTTRSIPSPGAGAQYNSVVWSGSVFAAVGGTGSTGAAATSPDGITWTQRTIPAGYYNTIAWGASAFVALGNSAAAASSPDGVTWTARTIPAGSYTGSAFNGSVFAAVGTSVAASSTDGLSWTSRTIPAGTYYGAASGAGGPSFSSGEKTLTGTPTGTTFTYAETGSDGTLTQAQTATPLTAAFVDSVPNGFIGTALYTNDSQRGILSAGYMVGGAKDLALYRGSVFYANVTNAAATELYLLSVGGTGGVQNGDTVVIDGLAYTAGASESVSGRTFQAYTGGTPAQNIANTAASLIRILNRTQSNSVYAMDLSGPSDPPGHIRVWETAPGVTQTVTFTGHPGAWSIGTVTAAGQAKNQLSWSMQLAPDSVPLVNYALVGAADKEILRVVPTRDSLFIFKEDGLWRLTGDASPWNIQPFDPTCILKAPDSAVMLDNSVFALTNQGVVRVTDTGVSVVSRPIETAILPLIGPAMIATTYAYAFGVAYESARKFYLFLPTTSSDTDATQAYVYDLFTDAWTHDTRSGSHALVNPADDRLYLVDGANFWQERKTFTVADYSDGTNPIACAVQWSPKFGDPGSKVHFGVVSLIFRTLGGTTCSLAFSTDLVSTPQTVSYTLTDYGTPPLAPFILRTYTPLEASRGQQLNVQFSESVNGQTFQIQGLSINYRQTVEEAGY